ncbi:MAG: GatB/YqeY domain-containing protein [Candidatus Cloacimonetes bacterium]|nr:GatB/YqeY domain-containing protein [Candidatus Cloacimonadota bacterium]
MVKTRLEEAIITALRSHDKQRLMALRTLKSAIRQVEIDQRVELEEEAVLEILQGQLKQREQAKELYIQGGRQDLADTEEYEMEIIREYLPQPLTDAELEEAVKKAIDELAVTAMSDMGRVMKYLKEELGSQADGKRLSGIVRNHLSNK